jgi:hypothetical protein
MTDAAVPLALLAAHLLADFPLQTDRMARAKITDSATRFEHAAVHGVVTVALLLPIVSLPVGHILAAGLGITGLHSLIDRRRWAEPKEHFEAYPLAVDQTLHVCSLYVVAVVLL